MDVFERFARPFILESRAPGDGMVADERVSQRSERRNLSLIVQLRWIAIVGQVGAILYAGLVLDLAIAFRTMLCVAALLAVFNVATVLGLHGRKVSRASLFAELLVDVLALTVQLYLSGGATNPFVSLFLLQVILGAVLFETRSSFALAGVATLCYFALTQAYRPLMLPQGAHGSFLDWHLHGMFACFVLASGLLCAFVSRINRNLARRDRELADLREQARDQAHIVRLGLLASGAAHELGTPLSTMAVLLGDWRHMPAIREDAELAEDVAQMQNEVARCREILSGVLLSSGQIRGEGTLRTDLAAFLDASVAEWREGRAREGVDYVNLVSGSVPIVSDAALRQILFSLFDNAAEACESQVTIRADLDGNDAVVRVADDGPGFPAGILASLGKPYRSTKREPGRGLGLFLVANVVRTLDGDLRAVNRPSGGAEVTIRLPLRSLCPQVLHG